MEQGLVGHLGYVIVLLGTLIEGETFILLGGFFAHQGYLHLAAVIGVATLGAASGDVVYFLAGRHYGRSFLTRSTRARNLLPRLERAMARFHALWIFGMRYMVGARWLGAALAGTTDITFARYLTLALPASLLWALVMGLLGFTMGEVTEKLLSDVKQYEARLLLFAIACGGVIFVVQLLLRRFRGEGGRDLSSGDGPR